jgi:hypothetical protein
MDKDEFEAGTSAKMRMEKYRGVIKFRMTSIISAGDITQ